MSESQRMCAARVAGVVCKNAGQHQRLETVNVHERFLFQLCDEHSAAWNAGQVGVERLDPSRIVTWVE